MFSNCRFEHENSLRITESRSNSGSLSVSELISSEFDSLVVADFVFLCTNSVKQKFLSIFGNIIACMFVLKTY